MQILACGINHKTTPVAIRERSFFNAEEIPSVLHDLLQQQAANEAILLSTCNRTEIYLHNPSLPQFENWMQMQSKLSNCLQAEYWYQHSNENALKHILRVATGLDSLLMGEPQIFGQMKSAFQLAKESGSVKQNFERLFQQIFSYSKLIRHETELGKNAITLAYIAVKLIKNIFSDIKRCRALLVGAGETIELIATHLHRCGVQQIIVANRDFSKAQLLSQKISGNAIQLSDIPTYLAESEIVITATASQLPLIGKGAVERALKLRKHRPIFMLDAAVPRDIEPEVATLEDIYLYSLDDLKDLIEKNLSSRNYQAEQAEEMIDLCCHYLVKKMSSLEAADVIARLRSKIQNISAEELIKAQQLLKQGLSIEEIMQRFANNLTNKILHAPSVNLRLASENKRKDILATAEDLFDL